MTNKEEFIELLRSTKRAGIEDCIVIFKNLGSLKLLQVQVPSQ